MAGFFASRAPFADIARPAETQGPAAIGRSRPRVPDPWRVYAVGDVHGRADLLARLLATIDADAARHPERQALLVLLGDYIDRGSGSRDVVRLLVERGRRERIVCLRGNHEDCALQALASPEKLGRWLRLGALPTLTSYGVPLGRNGPDPAESMARFGDALPRDHRAFLEGLPVRFECGDYFFAHAGLRPGVPLDQQSDHDLMWIRNSFLDSRADHGKVVVHGHTPRQAPEALANRINVDTGAYMTNRLTCLVLDGVEQRFLHTP